MANPFILIGMFFWVLLLAYLAICLPINIHRRDWDKVSICVNGIVWFGIFIPIILAFIVL